MFDADETDMSINEVLFLRTRMDNKNTGSLVASGPKGYVNFWNVFGGGTLLARIPPSVCTIYN